MADGKVLIETELSTKQFDRQITKLRTDIDRYMRVLESDAKVPVSLKMSTQEKQELEATVERLKNQLVGLENQARKTGEVGDEAGQRSGKGFEKGIKSLKRFGVALLGVRGMFSIVRRATSSYLSQNEETANKLNSIWVALGNALGPIIEIIADGVLKIIGYLNVFLRALGFDIDLTKNMNKSTKAIQGTTKAMKELNNEVYSFDEMNKQSKETSIGGGSSDTGTNGFKMPELNQDIVKFLEDTAKWLKENWNWLSAILGLIAGIKILKWLTGLGSVIDLLKIASTIGVIALGVDLIYNAVTGRNLIEDLKLITTEFGKLGDIHKKNAEMNEENNKTTKELIKAKKEEEKQYEKNSKEIARNFDYYRSIVQVNAEHNLGLAKTIDKMSGFEYWLAQTTGEVSAYNRELITNNDTMREGIQAMVDMYNAGQLNEEQQQKLYEILNSVNGTIVDGKAVYDDMDISVLKASKHTEDYAKVVDASDRKLQQTSQNSKGFWDNITNNAETAMNTIDGLEATPKIKADASQFQETLNKIGENKTLAMFLGMGTLNSLANIRLAKGGIVNNPGRGVPLSNVITGEATNGAEGVVPLNNEQSMDLIGQSIARHVVINLTNNTMLDSRVIARETSKINNDMNFITNGRGV